MGISTTVSETGDQVTIAVAGKFDFQLYDEFRASYADTAGSGVRYVVDLAETEYLDGGEASDIEISQASPEVKKILDVANFGKLFKI